MALLFTGLNILGIRASARINAGLAAAMGVVIAIFFVCAARFILGHPHGGAAFFTRPFYDPATFSTGAVLGGTSIAVLTYIGFDGISTLSEETENPRRNILLATVPTCVAIGILSAFEVYAAQLAWPASQPFPDETTAFVYAAGRTWAPLFAIVGFTLVVANFGSGMGAQLGTARLLFGMGRSNALPKRFFGAIEPKRRIPRNNVVFVGAVSLIGAFLLDYDLGAQMLNFGRRSPVAPGWRPASPTALGEPAASAASWWISESPPRARPEKRFPTLAHGAIIPREKLASDGSDEGR
jgi:amino acid transporter